MLLKWSSWFAWFVQINAWIVNFPFIGIYAIRNFFERLIHFAPKTAQEQKKGNSNENRVYNLYKLLLFIMYSHMKNNWNLSQFQKVHAFIFTELIFVFIIQSTYLEPFAFFLSLHLFLFCDFSSFFQLFLCVPLSFFACVLYMFT